MNSWLPSTHFVNVSKLPCFIDMFLRYVDAFDKWQKHVEIWHFYRCPASVTHGFPLVFQQSSRLEEVIKSNLEALGYDV